MVQLNPLWGSVVQASCSDSFLWPFLPVFSADARSLRQTRRKSCRWLKKTKAHPRVAMKSWKSFRGTPPMHRTEQSSLLLRVHLLFRHATAAPIPAPWPSPWRATAWSSALIPAIWLVCLKQQNTSELRPHWQTVCSSITSLLPFFTLQLCYTWRNSQKGANQQRFLAQELQISAPLSLWVKTASPRRHQTASLRTKQQKLSRLRPLRMHPGLTSVSQSQFQPLEL